MNIKAMIPTLVAVIVALVLYDLFIRKMIIRKETYEEYYEDEE